jgi:hypothetical protein
METLNKFEDSIIKEIDWMKKIEQRKGTAYYEDPNGPGCNAETTYGDDIADKYSEIAEECMRHMINNRDIDNEYKMETLTNIFKELCESLEKIDFEANNKYCLRGLEFMSDELLLKIGKINCTKIAKKNK